MRQMNIHGGFAGKVRLPKGKECILSISAAHIICMYIKIYMIYFCCLWIFITPEVQNIKDHTTCI